MSYNAKMHRIYSPSILRLIFQTISVGYAFLKSKWMSRTFHVYAQMIKLWCAYKTKWPTTFTEIIRKGQQTSETIQTILDGHASPKNKKWMSVENIPCIYLNERNPLCAHKMKQLKQTNDHQERIIKKG